MRIEFDKDVEDNLRVYKVVEERGSDTRNFIGKIIFSKTNPTTFEASGIKNVKLTVMEMRAIVNKIGE